MTGRLAGWITVVLAVVATGCGGGDPTAVVATAVPKASAAASATPQANHLTYTCDGGKAFEATFFVGQERATLVLDGKTTELKQNRAASGTSYGDGTLTLRTEGTSAFIQQGGQTTYRDCESQAATQDGY